MKENTFLNVVVGGAGNGGTTHISRDGGYNGGGNVKTDSDGNVRTASGGGATHIALVTGELYELEEKVDDIIIVAGGGRRKRI